MFPRNVNYDCLTFLTTVMVYDIWEHRGETQPRGETQDAKVYHQLGYRGSFHSPATDIQNP